jgi:glycine hydroxymethyltransferase
MRFNPTVDAELKGLINQEIERQQTTLSMIPSENCLSPDVVHLLGSVLNNKYAEG